MRVPEGYHDHRWADIALVPLVDLVDPVAARAVRGVGLELERLENLVE